MKLRIPPPPDRTPDQLRHHFEVEKSIATRLKLADRMERARIYRSMYDELFSVVPDHPRLTRRNDERRTQETNAAKLKLFRRFVKRDDTVVEFGPGDCRFAFELCKLATRVLGVDISDQRGSKAAPDHFELVVYDGYTLDIEPGSAQVVISDQLIEHFHPEDTEHHFRIVRDLLHDGGRYVFRTPHRYNGPHDVSKYFTQEPQGFHLKEWTYGELEELLKRIGYESCWGYVCLKSWAIPVPAAALRLVERTMRFLPNAAQRVVRQYVLRDIFLSARKGH